MWRVALAGLVIACGGASTEVRPAAAPAPAEALAAATNADSEAHASATLTSARPSAGPGAVRPDRDAIRDAIRDPRQPRQPAIDGAPPLRPEVRCADPVRCPPAVGLVVFPGQTPDLTGRIPEVRCTGTLIAPDRVLTASHCVTTPTCRDGWIAFPATAEHPATSVRCAWVLAKDPDDADAVLLEDWALLQLEQPVARPVATMASEPVAPGTIVTVASVTPHPIYDRQHELDARLCRVETAEEAEARLGPDARRVGWLSGCPIEHGNSGSPVLDQAGRVRALVHAGSHPVFGIGVTTALPTGSF